MFRVECLTSVRTWMYKLWSNSLERWSKSTIRRQFSTERTAAGSWPQGTVDRLTLEKARSAGKCINTDVWSLDEWRTKCASHAGTSPECRPVTQRPPGPGAGLLQMGERTAEDKGRGTKKRDLESAKVSARHAARPGTKRCQLYPATAHCQQNNHPM